MKELVKDFSETWLDVVKDTIDNGSHVEPRGKVTKEVIQRTVVVDMVKPVLLVPARKLSYTFMLAEAYWILNGDDQVSTIAPYNKKIAEFSDDGERFFGAYGPKIKSQLPYVVDKLFSDRDTRQAGINIWRERPPRTKDVPCTVSIFFNVRNDMLNANVFMRSSDVWLGLPYDVFNFSMLAHLVCALFNERIETHGDPIQPGLLYLTAASSHIYKDDIPAASSCLIDPVVLPQPETPDVMWRDPYYLMTALAMLRDLPPGHKGRWWHNN